MKAYWCPYTLRFRFEARTSRQTMHVKDTWLVRIVDEEDGREGVGECAMFRGLSAEDSLEYEDLLMAACRSFDPDRLPEQSSIRFGFETALANLAGRPDNDFTRGKYPIYINGLIWMV
ncbi:MAG: o-succinylbenzoate synthase, partial [Muribaculaceae bacterium]|nr:o-succinylbenzoate synthase [Muribaculaceae bacterium]